MAELVEQTSAVQLKCNTCKAVFNSSQEIKDHYRTDWHVLNSKRRAQQLSAVSEENFNLLVKQGGFKTPKPIYPGKATYVPKPKIEPKKAVPVPEPEPTSEDNEPVVDEKPMEPPKLGANISVFDDKVFETVDECVSYMSITFGFFIPDIECLTDLDGLLLYIGEKVKLGNYCLYCQKVFPTFRAAQAHMISKSHCKLCYDDDVDLHEFESFYDFESIFEDVKVDEDGNEIEEADMEVSEIGELVLPDGRRLGHRDFRVYYRQYYRPEEERPDVLAAQREELLRLGYQFGGVKAEIGALSDTQVMTELVKLQKDIRRGQIAEQRAAIRTSYQDLKREFRSTKDKLRSSENTTAKIRDYHGRLM